MYHGQLKIMVLKCLHEKEGTGYGIIKAISITTGYWKPSTGSLYPVLEELLNDGLIVAKQKEGKKIYHLAPKGEEAIRRFVEKREKIIDDLMSHLKVSDHLCNIDESGMIMHMLEQMKRNPGVLHVLADTFHELRDEVFRIIANGALEKNMARVRKILKHAVIELKKLK